MKNVYHPTRSINRFFLRLVPLIIIALLGTTLPRVARAQSAWQATYWNNQMLAGEPALMRIENNIDFRWGSRSPAPGQIGRDRFSARWTRTIDLEGGRYRFAVTADDGIRLYVNSRLLINEWHDQAATTYTVEENVVAGPTDIRIDYYENADQATARFSYAKVLDDTSPSTLSTPPVPTMMQQANWRGEYFDNVTLSGEPLFARNDNAIAFDWGNGSPAPNQLGTERFSIHWSDTLSLTPGTYRFVVTADDGVRLWINGELVVDHFAVQSARTHTVARSLPDGRAAIVMEYFENTGVATAQLAWQRIDDSAVERATPTPVDPLTDILAANPGFFSATVANTSNLNVRRGPGVEYRIQTVLNQNQRVIVTGRNRTTAWVEIRFGNGERGWVNRRYLQSNNSYRTLPPAE